MKDKISERKHRKFENKDNSTQKKSLEKQVIFLIDFSRKTFQEVE